MVVTDLDGTLLGHDRRLSTRDEATLVALGSRRIVRVVATGRSLYSANRALRDPFPIDYLVFSSGAGVLDWATGEALLARSLPAAQMSRITGTLIHLGVSFMVHHPIPENHRFVYVSFEPEAENPDFWRRVQLYQEFAEPLGRAAPVSVDACQALAIIPNDPARFEMVREALDGVNVIRTTSPLDGDSIWVEIFPADVSKASAAAWLARRLGIPRGKTLGLGNDYNDLDLLHWTHRSFVVANAPPELKRMFEVTAANTDNGLSRAVEAAGILPDSRSLHANDS